MPSFTIQNGLYNLCNDVPIHLRGLLGTRPAYGEGALYPMFARMWRNYTLHWEQQKPAEVGADCDTSAAGDGGAAEDSLCSDCPAQLDVCPPLCTYVIPCQFFQLHIDISSFRM